MKTILIIAMAIYTSTETSDTTDRIQEFKSKRISKTASFIVNADIQSTFMMYDAFEERKWAPGWEPLLIYPGEEIIQEGTAFSIVSSPDSKEGKELWVVTKYNPDQYLVQYMVSTENRFWTITVENEALPNGSITKTTVTYTFTGLNNYGNQLNQAHLDRMFAHNLQDWAKLINEYFSETLHENHPH